MKLGNFFVGNVFTISQSPHGVNQNGKAIDAVPTSGTRVIAPCDMDIYYRANNLGHQSYSYARGEGFSRLVLVHCIIEKAGFVKKGTDIGYLASGGAVHLHTAIEVNGAWDVVLNYMDRSIQLALTPGFTSHHWKFWSTWKDLTLGNNNMAIEELKKALDGMTKDRDKYAKAAEGFQKDLGNMINERDKYSTMVGDLNKRIEEQEITHENYVKELNLKYSIQQQQLINCEDDRQPLLKKVEDLKSKLTTANAELDRAAKIISKLIQDNKGTNIDWGSYINKLIRAIKSFIARNARDNS